MFNKLLEILNSAFSGYQRLMIILHLLMQILAFTCYVIDDILLWQHYIFYMGPQGYIDHEFVDRLPRRLVLPFDQVFEFGPFFVDAFAFQLVKQLPFQDTSSFLRSNDWPQLFFLF